jgi:hypothetical protein
MTPRNEDIPASFSLRRHGPVSRSGNLPDGKGWICAICGL